MSRLPTSALFQYKRTYFTDTLQQVRSFSIKEPTLQARYINPRTEQSLMILKMNLSRNNNRSESVINK